MDQIASTELEDHRFFLGKLNLNSYCMPVPQSEGQVHAAHMPLVPFSQPLLTHVYLQQ